MREGAAGDNVAALSVSSASPGGARCRVQGLRFRHRTNLFPAERDNTRFLMVLGLVSGF